MDLCFFRPDPQAGLGCIRLAWTWRFWAAWHKSGATISDVPELVPPDLQGWSYLISVLRLEYALLAVPGGAPLSTVSKQYRINCTAE